MRKNGLRQRCAGLGLVLKEHALLVRRGGDNGDDEQGQVDSQRPSTRLLFAK
jgi:hypothetical protein